MDNWKGNRDLWAPGFAGRRLQDFSNLEASPNSHNSEIPLGSSVKMGGEIELETKLVIKLDLKNPHFISIYFISKHKLFLTTTFRWDKISDFNVNFLH